MGLAYAAVQVPMVVGLVRGRAQWHGFLVSPLVAAPLTAAVGVGMAMASPLLAGIGVAQNGLVQFALAASISTLLGYAGGRVVAEDSPRSKTQQRGTIVAEQPRMRRAGEAATDARPKSPWRAASFAAQDETKHFKLIGTTGTGKSTAIQEILTGALARGDRAVIADPDGGYLQRFYDPARGDVVLNPFDERSVKWDLFAEIKSAYDVEQLARSLIPDHEGADRSWRGYARTFFSAVTRQAHEAGVTDVAELYRLMVVADTKELRTLVRGTAGSTISRRAQQPHVRLDSLCDQLRGRRARLHRAAARLVDSRFANGLPRNARACCSCRTRPGRSPRCVRPSRDGCASRSSRRWIERNNRRDEAGDEARRLWFVVDELDALGQIDGLKDALARLRKFGGRCVLGFQSIAQVSSTYGQGDAHTIVENCGNTFILRCSASEGGGTARFASQLIGEREVLRTTVSRSRRLTDMVGSISHSEHFNVEPAVLPSQIEQLPDLTGYLKHASDPQWQRVRLDAKAAWEERRSAQAHAARAADRAKSIGREGRTHE